MNERTIGNNVQMYRQIRELSQVDLAKRIGATAGTLSHIEKGTRKPSLDMLYSIADALNVSVLNLVMDDTELTRFYYDEQVQALYAGSDKLKLIIDKLRRDSAAWGKASNIAVINLDDLEKGKL